MPSVYCTVSFAPHIQIVMTQASIAVARGVTNLHRLVVASVVVELIAFVAVDPSAFVAAGQVVSAVAVGQAASVDPSAFVLAAVGAVQLFVTWRSAFVAVVFVGFAAIGIVVGEFVVGYLPFHLNHQAALVVAEHYTDFDLGICFAVVVGLGTDFAAGTGSVVVAGIGFVAAVAVAVRIGSVVVAVGIGPVVAAAVDIVPVAVVEMVDFVDEVAGFVGVVGVGYSVDAVENCFAEAGLGLVVGTDLLALDLEIDLVVAGIDSDVVVESPVPQDLQEAHDEGVREDHQEARGEVQAVHDEVHVVLVL